MKGFGKRALVLSLFVVALSIPLILFKTFTLKPTSPSAQPEGRQISAIEQAEEKSKPPPAIDSPANEPTPDAQQPTAALAPPLDDAAAEALDDSPLDFFGDDDEFPNDADVEDLLREHIKKNHPALRLSDGQIASLAESMREFREARAKMRGLERTSANASAIKESLERTVSAMDEFTRITGMTPGEFFLEGEPPVIFGNMEQRTNDTNEFPTENFSGSRP